MLCQFRLHIKVNHLSIHTQPLFFGFPSPLDHHRALSSVPCAAQVLTSYLRYTQSQERILIYFNHISQGILFTRLVSVCLFSMSVSLFFLCKQVPLYQSWLQFLSLHSYLFLFNILNSICISNFSLNKDLSESNDTLRSCSFRKHQAHNLPTSGHFCNLRAFVTPEPRDNPGI